MNPVLVFRTGALGDVVLTLPVFETLRASYPRSELHLVGRPGRLALASHLDVITHDIDTADWAPWFAPGAVPPPPGPLTDLVGSAGRILSYLPDPDHSMTHRLERICSGTVLFHPPAPPGDGTRHAVDHLLQPLADLGLHPATTVPSVRPTPTETQSAGQQLSDLPRPLLVVHPGSGGRAKCWLPEGFAQVADRFVDRTGGSVLLTGGPADEGVPERVASRMSGTSRILSPETPRAFAALLAAADAYLGNDSGPSHLAAAVGTPAVVLFGPTAPAVWAPKGREPVIIFHEPDLSKLRPESVTSAVVSLA